MVYFIKFNLLINIFILKSYSQVNKFGIPFIKNYTSTQYNASTQNWASIEDNRGVMYFGNNDCILEFDGINWNKIYTKNNSGVLSFCKDSLGTIFVGATGEFGYLKPNKHGISEFISLSSNLDSTISIGDIWKIFIVNNSIYFSSSINLFQYNYSNVKIIGNSSTKNGNVQYFNVDNQILLGNLNEGLLLLKDTFMSINFSKVFINDYIMSIIDYDKNIKLIASYLNGISFYNLKTGEKFNLILPEKTIEFFKQNNLTQALKINSEKYFFPTFLNGILFTDNNFEVKQLVNKNNGLHDNTCYNVFSTNSSTLWASLNDGISKIEINSGLTKFSQNDGIEGSILDIIRYDSILYISTNLGLFYLNYSNDTIFQKIGNITNEAWILFNFLDNDKAMLILGANNGLFEIYNKKIKKFEFLTEISENASFCIIENINKHIFIGGKKGLIELKHINNKWLTLKKIIKYSDIRTITFDNDSNLWFSTLYDGIVKITPTNDTIEYKENSGLPSIKDIQIYNFDDKLYFATQKGLYKYNETTNKFEPNNIFGDVYSNGSCGIYLMAQDDSTIWINCFNESKEWIERVKKNNSGTYNRDTIAFKRLEIKSLQAIYPDKDGIVWFGTSDALYSYDTKFVRNYYEKYYCLIRKITVGEDSVIFHGNYYKPIDNEIGYVVSTEQPKELILKFPYKENSLTFEFAAPYFEAEEKTEFSCYLEGFDKKWTKYKTENKAIYTNIPEGNYVFKVKARNVYGVESVVAEYKFSIEAPWYRTILAYILYIVLGIALIVLIIKLYARQLIKEKHRLEAIVKERTKEIMKQKDEIEEKNNVLTHQKAELFQQKEEIEAQRDELELQKVELENQRDELDAKNKIVMLQKDKIEKQNHDIKDSIHYASRIQTAILPQLTFELGGISNMFILFRPRDIVSGDFYWIRKKEDKLIFIAADCTGHGVPGAFMSMLGISLLNEIVLNMNEVKGSEILNTLRKGIIKSLHQTGEIGGSQDGMDVSMVIIDEKAEFAEFTGANNPLILVRKIENDFSEFPEDDDFKFLEN